MSGYSADLDAIAASRGALLSTVDSLAATLDRLDGSVCAGVGPGRLATAAAAVTEHARSELDQACRTVTEDAALVAAAAREYAEADQAAAAWLTGRAGDSG